MWLFSHFIHYTWNLFSVHINIQKVKYVYLVYVFLIVLALTNDDKWQQKNPELRGFFVVSSFIVRDYDPEVTFTRATA